MERGRVPENRLKIIGASATVCVRVCVCGIAGGRDGRQGCKGEEVARKQRRKKRIDALFVCTEALEAAETQAEGLSQRPRLGENMQKSLQHSPRWKSSHSEINRRS